MANRSINFISESIALLSHRVKYVDVLASHRIAGSQREFKLDLDWTKLTHGSVAVHRIAVPWLCCPLSVLLNSLATARTTPIRSRSRSRSTTKSRTLYKAVNKMCISLNSLSERRLADGSVRWPALHILRPIKMHFAKNFLPPSLPGFFLFRLPSTESL